jgi:hypothetical protein
MTIDYDQLTTDLKEACKVAQATAESVQDLGSCNLDYIKINIGKPYKIKRCTKKVKEAAQAAGCKIVGPSPYHLSLHSGFGQASKRTLALQAACDYLSSRGWDVSMRYVLD